MPGTGFTQQVGSPGTGRALRVRRHFARFTRSPGTVTSEAEVRLSFPRKPSAAVPLTPAGPAVQARSSLGHGTHTEPGGVLCPSHLRLDWRLAEGAQPTSGAQRHAAVSTCPLVAFCLLLPNVNSTRSRIICLAHHTIPSVQKSIEMRVGSLSYASVYYTMSKL